MILVEFGDRRLERELAACDLELLHEIGGASEQNAPTILDQRHAERRRQMRFPGARRPEDKRLAPFSSQLSPAASA